MIGVDDTLDDAHWVNVQDPIKQMFLAITKAIRAQSAGIRDLDRKCNEFVTHDRCSGMIANSIDNTCSKQDATQIIYKLDTKVGDKDFALMESKLKQAYDLIDKQANKLHEQTLTIADMSIRIDTMSKDINQLKNPNYDQIFSYIDRQIANTVSDTDRKLELKSDTRYVDNCLPQRLENLYRDLNVKVNDMKVDVMKAATKEELLEIAGEKATVGELRALAVELNERTTRSELHQSINNHVKPLVTALGSLEAAMQVQDNMAKQTQSSYMEKASQLERMYEEQQQFRLTHAVNASRAAPASADRVQQMIDDTIRDRRLGEVNQLHLDLSLAQQSEYVLKQMGIMSESIRLELATANRDENSLVTNEVQNLKTFVTEATQDITEKNLKTKQTLKELSMNVAKALSKKLDIRDYKKLAKDRNNEVLNYIQTSGGGDSRSVMNTSRDLLNTSNAPRANAAHDSNREFEYLLQSMAEGGSSGRSRSNSNSNPDDDEDYGIEAEERKQQDGGSFHMSRSFSRMTGGGGHTPERTKRGSTPFSKRGNTSRASSPASTTRPHSSGGAGGGVSIAKADVSTLRVLVQSLVKQSERMEERLSVYQHELASIREQQRAMNFHQQTSGGGGGTGSGAVGSPQRLLNSSQGGGADLSQQHATSQQLSAATTSELEKLDWRLAIGEVSMNLRRELADKASREELYSAVRSELGHLEERLSHLQRGVDAAASSEGIATLDNEVLLLKHKVSGEITGARFLWTSGKVIQDGWVPWEIQAVNAAPSNIQWRKGGTNVQVKIPGLYRISVAVFTTVPAVLQLYLNDEPAFSYQPESLNHQSSIAHNTSGAATTPAAIGGDGGGAANIGTTQKSDRYYLRRLRHSAGEVSCLCIEEFISLPPDAKLSVRYHSAVPAQGFIALRKL